jgi:hypothetical protein
MTSSNWDQPVSPGGPTVGQLALSSRGYKQSYDYV